MTSKTTKTFLGCALLAALSTFSIPAQAGPIIAPTSGVINSGGPGFGSLADTFNQSGFLSCGYTAGVTDFDAFVGSGCLHTTVFAGFEWFSNQGSSTAVVTYDFGSTVVIDALALWNEESSGIGSLNLLGSTDGENYFGLASGLSPTDHALASYGADVFSFTASSLRYVRFEMSRCPQAIVGSFAACAIGEVAFRTGTISSVPEPGTLGLLGASLLSLGFAWRRHRRA